MSVSLDDEMVLDRLLESLTPEDRASVERAWALRNTEDTRRTFSRDEVGGVIDELEGAIAEAESAVSRLRRFREAA